jgi:hypothetical protein
MTSASVAYAPTGPAATQPDLRDTSFPGVVFSLVQTW